MPIQPPRQKLPPQSVSINKVAGNVPAPVKKGSKGKVTAGGLNVGPTVFVEKIELPFTVTLAETEVRPVKLKVESRLNVTAVSVPGKLNLVKFRGL